MIDAARLNGRTVVASVSGGKDSAAMCLALREAGIECERVFLDTGWEHPLTYEYLRGPLTDVLGPITEIRAGLDMVGLIRKKAMFPSRLVRFCTVELKVKPIQAYFKSRDDEIANAVGIRRAESRARSEMSEWEWSKGFDCEVWRPIIGWTEQDVIDIHTRHGLRPNPLYLMGARRVGCWPCIMASKSEIRLVADIDPGRIDLIRSLEVEAVAGATARAEARGERMDNPPAFFQAAGVMRSRLQWRTCPECGGCGCEECESGRVFVPTNGRSIPIDEIVAWSRTTHGGRQMDMFGSNDQSQGCMRWGLCDAAEEDSVAEHKAVSP